MSTENLIKQAEMATQVHDQVVTQIIESLQLVAPSPGSGSATFTSAVKPEIQGEADVLAEVETTLINMGMTSKRHTVSYWRTRIEQALMKMKAGQLVAAAKIVAHERATLEEGGDGSSLTKVRAFTNLLVGGLASEVDVAVVAHFIWQIKRKMNNLPVTWHMMPVLWGATGAGKSVALHRLLEPISRYVLVGLSLDKIGDDRYFRQFAEHLVVFLDEMPKVERASIEHIKQVITAGDLTGRLLYSNAFKRFPQRCTFLGTSNESPSQLIKDSTGMRRFHYIRSADRMDWKAMNALDMLAVWREVDERRERPYILEVSEQLREAQEEVRLKDALEEFIIEGHLVASNDFRHDAPRFRSKDAYDVFRSYCEQAGYAFIITKQSFNRQLVERYDFVKVREKDLRFPSFYGTLNRNPERIGVVNKKGL